MSGRFRSMLEDHVEASGQLQVCFLPLSLGGRVGFTLAPGRRGRDDAGRFWTRDLEEDLDRLVGAGGAHRLVCLLSPEELEAARIGQLERAAAARELEVEMRPLLPSPRAIDLLELQPIITALTARAEAGETVVLVSGDGLGRAPLVAACLLVTQGRSARRALEVVQRVRGPGCLEDVSWLELVEAFEGGPPSEDGAGFESPEPSEPRWLEGDEPPDPPWIGGEGDSGGSEAERAPVLRTAGARHVAQLYASAPAAAVASPWSAGGARERPEPADPPEPDRAGPEAVPRTGARPRDAERPPREAGAPTRAGWTPLESACVGTVLGAALGDALGAPLDGERDIAALEARFGPEGPRAPVMRVPPGGGAPEALLSDDTQLAECALEALLDARRRRLELEATLDRLARNLGRWAEDPRGGHRDPDPSCLEVGRRLAAATPWAEAASNASSGPAGLPRSAVFGLAFGDDLRRAEQWGAAQCRVTHRGKEAVAASAALAVGIARLTRGERLDLALSEMVGAACRESPRLAARLARALHDADAGVPPSVWVSRHPERTAADALTAAVFVVRRHPDDLESALREAVMTPGASSTTAAASGALLGARLGAGALPPGWLAVLERRSTLEALALGVAATR